MNNASMSFEAAGVQPTARNVNSSSTAFDWRPMVTGLWVFVGYYLGAKLGFALTFRPHPVSILWPPNSILAAALLLTPLRFWWLVLVAAFSAHCGLDLHSQLPPMMVLCWFISSSCVGVIGA